jgi:DNA helicase-2/ATP-dependent DNA helicase PcrA
MNPYLNVKNQYPKLYEAYERLDEYQKNAVLDNHQYLLVKAHFGSGKTLVLLQKILYLHIIKNIPLKRIFCLTFTNKAADEILERFKTFGLKYTSKDVRYFGTFHSLARKLLDDHLPLEQIGYKKGFTVLDEDDRNEYISQLITANNLNIKYQNKIVKRLQKYRKEKQVLYGSMRNEDDLVTLTKLLKKQKAKDNVMSFDDLIDHCVFLLKQNQASTLCDYILVDEFQDSDEKQVELIQLLTDTQTGIFAVGDTNQSIYTWRGSDPAIFTKFQKETEAHTIPLLVNYRSKTNILEVAKIFLEDDFQEDIIGSRGNGNPITIKKHYNPFNEALYLADRIKKIVENGDSYKDIGIFYRKQCMSQSLEEVFDEQAIPYEKSLRKNIRDIPVLHWFICLLKASINPYDTYSFNSALLNDKFGVFNNKTALKNAIDKSTMNSDVELLKKIRKFSDADVEIEDLYEYFNLDKYLKPNSADYEKNKDFINRFIHKFLAYRKTTTLRKNDFIHEFVNNAALYGAQIIDERLNMDKDSVKLMTIHAAKGLEFKHVFISGANDGTLPILNREFDYDTEEKRLFFVGITRAKDELEISYHTSPNQNGGYTSSSPSRFIEMIPEQLIKIVDKEAESVHIDSLVKKIQNRNEKKERTKIKHHKYGVGELIANENGILTVDFENYGEKKFMEALEKIEYL